jgi:hypothetical protein
VHVTLCCIFWYIEIIDINIKKKKKRFCCYYCCIFTDICLYWYIELTIIIIKNIYNPLEFCFNVYICARARVWVVVHAITKHFSWFDYNNQIYIIALISYYYYLISFKESSLFSSASNVVDATATATAGISYLFLSFCKY